MGVRRVDESMEGRKDKVMDGQGKDERMKAWMDGGWMDGWVFSLIALHACFVVVIFASFMGFVT